MTGMFLDLAKAVAEERQAEARQARLARSVRQAEAPRRRRDRGGAFPVAGPGCCSEA